MEDDADRKKTILFSCKRFRGSIESGKKYRDHIIIKSFIRLTYDHLPNDVNVNLMEGTKLTLFNKY